MVDDLRRSIHVSYVICIDIIMLLCRGHVVDHMINAFALIIRLYVSHV